MSPTPRRRNRTAGAASANPDPAGPTTSSKQVGSGGETHQQASGATPALTSNQGVPLSDNQNTLRAGARGPALLEDFLLREKITHFDHERIPERVVHARGSAAHGRFECLRDCSDWTRAAFLSEVGKSTPVFARLSTVAGGAGSADTPRDVRGFAVKFYTEEGNYDLVGNNIPVFFIQDAMKFPDLVHAVKMEPDRGYPQAASAHDTFWDFISLMPESLHMVMWAMSDRTLPRSLRLMDGFGVHTFRFVNADGQSRFVKFHWRAELGVESTTFDEAVAIAGADPDYHRRDLREAIDRGDAPSWLLAVQVFDEAKAAELDFDPLDPTKLIPEEDVPLETIGRMTLDRNPDNFFAETEQVAFCPAHLVPGIDFSDDPLLQGRLFSYTDTQLSRLGGPNFHQLPINRPQCPMHNFQRDALMQTQLPFGRVNYEPNSLEPEGPRESPVRGFISRSTPVEAPIGRLRAESFADHYSQAQQFYRSQTAVEQQHIGEALAFELGKVETAAIRLRMLGHLRLIDQGLCSDVAQRLGLDLEAADDISPARPVKSLPALPSLSQQQSRAAGLGGKSLGLLVLDGADDAAVKAVRLAFSKGQAAVKVISLRRAGAVLASGTRLDPDGALDGMPSCLFDAVGVLGGQSSLDEASAHPAVAPWLQAAWRHLKPMGLDDSGLRLAAAAGLGVDEGCVSLNTKAGAEFFAQRVADGKVFSRRPQTA